jgi:hypothetical protein
MGLVFSALSLNIVTGRHDGEEFVAGGGGAVIRRDD